MDSQFDLKTCTSQVTTEVPGPKKRVYFKARLLVPDMPILSFLQKVEKPLSRSEACGKPYLQPSRLQTAPLSASPHWLCGTSREMDLSYLVEPLTKLVGGGVELAFGVANVRDPTRVPKGFQIDRTQAVHVFCPRAMEDDLSDLIASAFKNRGVKLGFGPMKFILAPSVPNGAEELEFVEALVGKQRALKRMAESKHIAALRDVDKVLDDEGTTIRSLLLKKKVTTVGPDGKERQEDLFLAVEPTSTRDRLRREGWSVFFHSSLRAQALAFVGDLIPRVMGRYGKEAAGCFLERSLIVAQRDYSYDKKTDTVISKCKAEHVKALQTGVLSQFETLTTEDLIQREVQEREQEKRKPAGQQGQQQAQEKPDDQVAAAQEAYLRQGLTFNDDSSLPSLNELRAGAGMGARRPLPDLLLNQFDRVPNGDDESSMGSLGSKSRQELRAGREKIAAYEEELARLRALQAEKGPPKELNTDDDDASISSMESMTTNGLGQEVNAQSQPGGGAANAAAPQHAQVAESENAAVTGGAGGGDPAGGAE